MKLEFSRQIFEKYSNNRFNENLPSGSRVIPRRQMGRQTGMAKLIVAFHNFVKALKIGSLLVDNQGSVVIVCVHMCMRE